MLGYIDNDRFLPTKHEVADHSTENHCETKPSVVGHEDQHEHQREGHLNDVKETLVEMHR